MENLHINPPPLHPARDSIQNAAARITGSTGGYLDISSQLVTHDTRR